MVSWSIIGRQPLLSIVAEKLGRAGRRAYLARRLVLPVLRLFVRFALMLAGLGLGVAAVAILAGLGWALLAGAGACFALEAIIKDDSAGSAAARRGA